ncbi:hypothetical protein M5K25_012443 [Dendrobium thyrsiflorum]|uniref:Uncharacterized protein n=1 Tax=Dendrobium thyrsiflorum TaxID=117978 RepID=A0ABD0UX15_DENTH
MAEMAKAMATMTAQLTALGAVPQAAGVGTPATSRDEAVVPPVLAPGPVGVDRVQRTVPLAPTTVTHSLPVQSQPAQSQLVQMTASQIQDLIAQKVEQAISSRKSGEDSIPAAVPPKVESQQSRRPQRQESSGAPPPRRGEVHSTYGPQDKGKKPLVSSVPPPQQQPHTQGQSAVPPRPSRRTPESQQYLQEKLSKEYPFKRESVMKIFKFLVKKNILAFPKNNRAEEEGQTDHPLYCPFHRHIGHIIEDCYVFKDRVERLLASGQIHLQDSDLVQPKGKAAQVVQTVSDVSQSVSQCDSQSSSSRSPCGSEGEWQLALSRKTKSLIRQAVQSSEAVERRPSQAKSTVASPVPSPVVFSSSVVVPSEHVSVSHVYNKKMYEREKFVVTSEGKTCPLPALTLKDFVLPPIDDEIKEEDDSGYFWSPVPSSSTFSSTRSFSILHISSSTDDPSSEDESEKARRPPTAQSPVAPASVGQGPVQSHAQNPGQPPVQGPSPVGIEASVATAGPVESPFQLAVKHDVPPSRGRGWYGGRGRVPARRTPSLDVRIPPPSYLQNSPLVISYDSSDDEMIDAPRSSAPSPALGINDHNSFPTFRRYMIPEGGLVIDSSSDEEADLRRQNTIQQASSSGASIPSRTRNHSVSALSKFFVPPQSSECASLSHSIGAPLGPEIQGPAETAVGRQVVRVPRYFSPVVEGYVKRGLTPSSWSDEQASQQARIWRTDFPQTTKGLGYPEEIKFTHLVIRVASHSHSASLSQEVSGESSHDSLPLFPTETRRQDLAGGEIPAGPSQDPFQGIFPSIEATSRLDVNRKIVAGLPRIPTSPRSPDSNVWIEVSNFARFDPLDRENEAKNPFRVSVSPCRCCMYSEPLIQRSTALIEPFRGILQTAETDPRYSSRSGKIQTVHPELRKSDGPGFVLRG